MGRLWNRSCFPEARSSEIFSSSTAEFSRILETSACAIYFRLWAVFQHWRISVWHVRPQQVGNLHQRAHLNLCAESTRRPNNGSGPAGAPCELCGPKPEPILDRLQLTVSVPPRSRSPRGPAVHFERRRGFHSKYCREGTLPQVFFMALARCNSMKPCSLNSSHAW